MPDRCVLGTLGCCLVRRALGCEAAPRAWQCRVALAV